MAMNGCGLQMDGFSAHFDQYEFIPNYFYYFHGDFEVVFGGLTLSAEGPRNFRDCPEGPGTQSEGRGAL